VTPITLRLASDLALVGGLRARARRQKWFHYGSSSTALGVSTSLNEPRWEHGPRRFSNPAQAPVTPDVGDHVEAGPAEAPTDPARSGIVIPFNPRSLGSGSRERNDEDPPITRVARTAAARPRSALAAAARRAGLIALTVTTAGASAAALFPPLLEFSSVGRVTEDIGPRIAARTAVWVRDRDGVALGTLPQDGSLQSIAVIPTQSVGVDFAQALRTLETQHTYFGVSPHRSAQAVLCFSVTALLRGREHAEENCPGGSTLLMQAATTLRGGKAGRNVIERKWTEHRDAAALSITLPAGYTNEDQFIASNLLFGYAGGRPIIGLGSASLILFGRRASQLSLAEAAILAATPKRQLAFYCATPTQATLGRLRTRWQEIRVRADYALTQGFPGDPRLATARSEVRAMADRITPAPLSAVATQGMTPSEACLAAADPVRRLELTDSSLRSLLARELQNLPRPGGRPIEEIRLSTTIEQQRIFKASVVNALREMSGNQTGRWNRPLVGGENRADVLALTAARDGGITGLYASSARGLVSEQRRLGSLSKLVALLAFAAAGRGPEAILCNRASGGLRNANGDRGYTDCRDPRAAVSLQTAFAQSLNLPILDGLRRIEPAILAQAANDAGFVHRGGDLAYAIAFGVAEAAPEQVAALAAAMARGASGQPAIAPIPHAIRQYRIDGRWHRAPLRWVDLRFYFRNERVRTLIAAAGGAPLRSPDGTLRGIVPAEGPVLGELAKSGTDAREQLVTYAKTAVGAGPGGSWFAMVAADRGPVGDRHVGIRPLVAVARSHAFRGH